MGAWVSKELRYRGAEARELLSDDLRVLLLPGWGGRIASLRARRSQGETELLLQPRSDQIASVATPGRYDGERSWGWDDLFPTVAPCPYGEGPEPELPLPDHGEIWSSPAESRGSRSSYTFAVRGSLLPYRLSKTLRAVPGGLRLEWSLENLGGRPLAWLWATHPLFAVEPGATYPVSPGTPVVEYEEPSGAADTLLGRGPVAVLPGDDYRGALKFFIASPREEGGFPLVIRRPGVDLSLGLSFDPRELPYLGVWVNARGWEDQYTLSLEPSTGLGDSLTAVRSRGSARVLAPGGSASWFLELVIL